MEIHGDFIIVGSGIAGLRAAVELAPAGRIIIITKANPNESNTEYAQGGIAAAIGPDDSPSLHAADTMRAGDGLCDERAVRVLTEEGPRYTQELLDWGARFDRNPDGQPALASEGAHSVRRVLHSKDATGREIGRVLWERAFAGPDRPSSAGVRVLTNTLATRILLKDDRCVGVEFLDESGAVGRAIASATVLATGGAGQVFRETTNPAVATGDGVALGYHAGARVADMEFVQFHPTVLDAADAPRFLLSEALRGEGAQLVNGQGEAFMVRYHPQADLAPRDVVARSIIEESNRSQAPIFLSLRHLDAHEVHRRFPTIAAVVLKAGFDLATDLIPVGPAAHYLMGGVETDLEGRTSVRGLFAAGEVACTRVHGANRLASNSLLEGLVFGARTGMAMKGPDRPPDLPEAVSRTVPLNRPVPSMRDLDESEIRDLMWKSVGLFRAREGLSEAVETLSAQEARLGEVLANRQPPDHEGWRRASLVTVAALIAGAALRREESRGGHFRNDFPAHDDLHWKAHISDQTQPR